MFIMELGLAAMFGFIFIRVALNVYERLEVSKRDAYQYRHRR